MLMSKPSRRAALASIPAAAAAAATAPSLATPSSAPCLMQQAIADADALWHRFWTVIPPPDDKDGTLFSEIEDLAREAQIRALNAPIERAADAIALLAFARRQLVTFHAYEPNGYPLTGAATNEDLDWQAFERACQFLGAAGPVPHRA